MSFHFERNNDSLAPKGCRSMYIRKSHIFMAVVALCAAPAFAWEHDFTRGLDLYSATDDGTTIRLVCDPNRVYGGNESMFLVVWDGISDLTIDATFVFPGGSTITAPLVRGRLAKRDLDGSAWQPLLDAFRNTSRVDLTVEDNTRSLNLGDPPAFTCI